MDRTIRLDRVRRKLILAAAALGVLLALHGCAVAEDSHEFAQFQTIIGAENRIRDVALFTTERGESAALVLYLSRVTVEDQRSDEALFDMPSCGEQLDGIALSGTYHVALVVDGALVNTVQVPFLCIAVQELSFPLRNFASVNYHYWGQGKAVERGGADPVEPTKLLRLADFNGDGKAWEFRLVQYDACGHTATLLGGYSARQRRVILYPIVRGPAVYYWSDNTFPNPATPDAKSIHYVFACGDHGSETGINRDIVYDDTREAWVVVRERHTECPSVAPIGGDTAPSDRPIRVMIGSGTGRPGERVRIPVSVDTGERNVAALQHDLLFNPRVPFEMDGSGGLIYDLDRSYGQCHMASITLQPVACTSDELSTCGWALHAELEGEFRSRSTLYEVTLAIPADTPPGTYALEARAATAIDAAHDAVLVRLEPGTVVVEEPEPILPATSKQVSAQLP